MLDESTTTDDQTIQKTADSEPADRPRTTRRRRAASRPAGPPETLPGTDPQESAVIHATEPASTDAGAAAEQSGDGESATAKKSAAKKTTAKKAAAKKTTAKKAAAKKTTAKKTTAKKSTAKKTTKKSDEKEPAATPAAPEAAEASTAAAAADAGDGGSSDSGTGLFSPVFQPPPEPSARSKKRSDRDRGDETDKKAADKKAADKKASDAKADSDEAEDDDSAGGSSQRRRRRRGGRRRRKSGNGSADNGDAAESADQSDSSAAAADDSDEGDSDGSGTSGSRRRRRRRRRGEDAEPSPDDPANTVVRVREPRGAEDEITALEGSTRMEAKKQRRREGRAAGRRRAPIVSEAEFLARRESVKRDMVIRQRADVTQIGVLEDDVLVEHYVARDSQTSLIGNVYLGRVQNVLPSMEAAFIDIGKGRNAVLYAGEVDWNALGMEGKPHRIEDALKSGQTVMVQVTKDPAGHKGARLTGQISLPGRFLVYVPAGHTSGISRKLPDNERTRLKDLLKQVLPEDAGVIVRTAAEGATEEQLNRDVTALTARWDDIKKKAEGNQAPQLLYAEPDLMLKVVRDLFNEDFRTLIVDGSDAADTIEAYVEHVAPDLSDRLERWTGGKDGDADKKKSKDVFEAYRIDEQIAKGLDRKVWLPSGGSLVIDRTEAMTVIDVNTGKFTGSGGNLEETVTKNNLEAAEEVVRQLRLRDIGGIIVIDFIDMVLESNRDLVLRRLVECLGRDRTRHQVAEVTSLGLVQMTRKRIGTGLLEAFSEPCEPCKGRGVILHTEPVEPKAATSDNGSSRRRGKRGGSGSGSESKSAKKSDPKSESKSGKNDSKSAMNAEAKSSEPKSAKKKSSSRRSKKGESDGGSESKAAATESPEPVKAEAAAS
jgi:ribonuclease E